MHVLIIEGVDLIAEMLRDALSQIGYASFDIAEDEDEAIRLARIRCPDLITAESKLRHGTGVAAIKRICEANFIPVVFVTADPQSVFDECAEAIVVEKPFIRADFRDAVARATDRGGARSTHSVLTRQEILFREV